MSVETRLGEPIRVVFASWEVLNLMSSSRVNAVEVLYAAFPALMYIDPTLGTPLLEPLFRFQVSPDYGVQFAAKDLGMSYNDAKTDIWATFRRIELS
jgi:hypothetical protein